MKIEYAILGLLSWKPLTGYDIKKIIQESTFMHWSGNNNQIYKALMNLSEDNLVSNHVIHQEGAPSKKEFSITEEGLSVLNNWVRTSELELPEYKKTFLVQLSWSESLDTAQIIRLLEKYQSKIEEELAFHTETKRREKNFPNRNDREQFIWEMLCDNMISSYENEIIWVTKFRKELEQWKK